ncbi:MAG TPA: GNAT family N-acetyltransferase [Burkholderiaceae bacterium]
MVATNLRFTVHDDDASAEAAVVDAGLGAANEEAAPLRDVRLLAVFAREPAGAVVGGAVGRTWGLCCELRQLWVAESYRGQGVGSELLRAFERRAVERGCRQAYLDTFSFQARPFYEALGYKVVLEISGFDVGISKYTMIHNLIPE